MLSETGRVVAVEAESLWVETIRQSTCGTCSAQKGCGHGLLNQVGNGRSNYLRVLLGDKSAHNYMVDDEVRIAIPEQVILRGSFVVYMIPLVMTLLVAGLVQSLLPGQDIGGIGGAVAGFLIGIGFVRWHAARHRDDPELQPRLLGPAHSAGVMELSDPV
jgi:sigma-E factor negative regulatory protein RseC